MTLRAPFPWFGGKSRASPLIWERFGAVANYIEPFFGSGAVLLGRPTEPRIETVNDLDAMVSNFWRAVQQDPEGVAAHADWPVSEPDLHARHRWLVAQLPEHRERMEADPGYCDAQIAGWWVWGLCQWIGGGWCAVRETPWQQRPHVSGVSDGMGVHAPAGGRRRPRLSAPGGGGMAGIHAEGVLWRKRPHLGGTGNGSGAGVHRHALGRKRPIATGDNPGRGVHSAAALVEWFGELQARLRRVRVCCGDWTRVLGPAVIFGSGITGILLDPPYGGEERTKGIYAQDCGRVAADVRLWALERGDNPRLRIAMCGFEGEHEMPAEWECVAWKSPSGYGGGKQRHRERIWFSPHCLRADHGPLFNGRAR